MNTSKTKFSELEFRTEKMSQNTGQGDKDMGMMKKIMSNTENRMRIYLIVFQKEKKVRLLFARW